MKLKSLFILTLVITFITSTIQPVGAAEFTPILPIPGQRVLRSPSFVPLSLKGLVIHEENAFKFDFILDTGNSGLSIYSDKQKLSEESSQIMKYFLTALTIPEEDMWVNLSPYEKGRIVENHFGQTLMGRDLLAQDYVLKQLTASLMYPEDELGKRFWREVYQKAKEAFGTTQVPVNTFNKVWIMPDQAVVWVDGGKVLIVKSRMKVLLEEDYLALQKNVSKSSPRPQVEELSQERSLPAGRQVSSAKSVARDDAQQITNEIVRHLVIPELEREVNEGKHFAKLRQMYQAMILATWYKKNLKQALINQVYADKNLVNGVKYQNSVILKPKGLKDLKIDSSALPQNDTEYIYQQYLAAYKKGVFNFIKEEPQSNGQTIPRKYFSGGFSLRRGISSLATKLTVLVGGLPLIAQKAIAQSTGSTIQATWQADQVITNATIDAPQQVIGHASDPILHNLTSPHAILFAVLAIFAANSAIGLIKKSNKTVTFPVNKKLPKLNPVVKPIPVNNSLKEGDWDELLKMLDQRAQLEHILAKVDQLIQFTPSSKDQLINNLLNRMAEGKNIFLINKIIKYLNVEEDRFIPVYTNLLGFLDMKKDFRSFNLLSEILFGYGSIAGKEIYVKDEMTGAWTKRIRLNQNEDKISGQSAQKIITFSQPVVNVNGNKVRFNGDRTHANGNGVYSNGKVGHINGNGVPPGRLSSQATINGGIDLNGSQLNLIQGGNLQINPDHVNNGMMNIGGLRPVLIELKNIDLPIMLGFNVDQANRYV